ncbi:MAG TPA: matrixin family metalloprotease [Gemmata sp.]|nr:matrixin family metalloprotease [Gemmata sp.]
MDSRPQRFGFIERLEDRSLPSAFGTPWPDAEHLTFSFAPDGTITTQGGSVLTAVMSQAASDAVWQREILRAFQTWAVNAGINIGVVKDGGQDFGVAGAVQGDSRFGDIRIGAAGGAADEVASAGPFSWTGSTISGDVFFSATSPYTIGNVPGKFDIFSVAIHEAGHVFGLEHSNLTDSVMNETYSYRTGLSSTDISAIQELYGVRQADAFDAARSNNTASNASILSGELKGAGLRYIADGDLTTLADVDYYKFTAPIGFNAVTVRLQAEGLSLVLPRVTVYDSLGRVVAAGVSRDPLNNDLLLHFNTSLLGGTFTVKVAGATDDVFGIGAYRLVADATLLGATLPALPALLSPVIDGLTNETLSAATILTGVATGSPDQRFDANYRGVIESASDTDFYQIRAPLTSPGGPMNLNVVVWGLDGTPLNPRLHLYDALGNPVAFQVLSNDTGIMSVQLQNVTPGEIYYIQVAARTPGGINGTGAYMLGGDFNQTAALHPDWVSGNTQAPNTSQTDTLTINQSGTYQFFLAAQQQATSGGVVTMTITDTNGNVVLVMQATAGMPLTTRVKYLSAGTYRVSYTTSGTAPIRRDLYILKLTDNVGPYASSPDGSSTSSTAYKYDSTSYSPPPSSSYYTY